MKVLESIIEEGALRQLTNSPHVHQRSQQCYVALCFTLYIIYDFIYTYEETPMMLTAKPLRAGVAPCAMFNTREHISKSFNIMTGSSLRMLPLHDSGNACRLSLFSSQPQVSF